MSSHENQGVSLSPRIPVSWGELADKICILRLKQERLTGAEQVANVMNELQQLERIWDDCYRGHNHQDDRTVDIAVEELQQVNMRLWDLEVEIRRYESEERFDAQFVSLARGIYKTNDRRTSIKRKINRLMNSELVEEKSYAGLGTEA